MKSKMIENRILSDLEELISESCNHRESNTRFEDLHRDLLRNHYNAADVDIDYHRKRIKMLVLTDESGYRPGGVNLNLPVVYVNLLFGNLREFLTGCLRRDRRSLSFYAQLLRGFKSKSPQLALT